jgi:hypothetical protein
MDHRPPREEIISLLKMAEGCGREVAIDLLHGQGGHHGKVELMGNTVFVHWTKADGNYTQFKKSAFSASEVLTVTFDTDRVLTASIRDEEKRRENERLDSLGPRIATK